jgi:hypothetical protein
MLIYVMVKILLLFRNEQSFTEGEVLSYNRPGQHSP